MGDDHDPNPEIVLDVVPEPVEEIGPDVAFVVPATAYNAIDTDGELARAALAELPHRDEDSSLTRTAIEAMSEAVQRKLDRLEVLFDREIRAESTREKVVDRLHAELQEYKQDLLLNVMRPVFVDLIQLHDDIGKIVEAHPDGDEPVRRLLGLVRGFQQGIEDILYRQGVEPFSNEGEPFDPRRQRAVATVPTSDAASNKTIAARHRKGFQAGDKVIRPEIVSVYAHRK